MKVKWLALILTTLAMGPAAFGATAQDLQNEIKAVLSQRTPVDTPDWWRSLGPGAPGVIIGMFKTDDNIYEKVRLLEALQWFDDPQAREFLREQARTSKNAVIRETALTAIGRLGGKGSEKFLKAYLHDPDPHTRLAAARGLQNLHTEKGDRLVQDFLQSEASPWVIRALKHPPRARRQTVRRSE